MNILIGFLWILAILAGAVAILFVFFKITSKNTSLGFQDFIIERVFGGGRSSAPIKTSGEPTQTGTPTPQKNPIIPESFLREDTNIAPSSDVQVVQTASPKEDVLGSIT